MLKNTIALICTFASVLVVVSVLGSDANASTPFFAIDEIYSNADGSVQFIVFEDTPSSLAGQTLIASNGSTEHTHTFPSDVPCSMFLYDFAEIHKGVGRNT
jgi:hypothetical protein